MHPILKSEKSFKKFLKPSYIALAACLIAGALLLGSSLLSYKNLEKSLNTGLRLQALSLEIVLQSLIKAFDFSVIKEKREFFSELLLNERWEGVAFIALYDENRTILLHSNPNLIGQKIEKGPLLTDHQDSGFYKLKTGEEVYLHETYIDSRGKSLILRIALHVEPVKESLSYAQKHFLMELILSLLLFTAGFGAFFILSRVETSLSKMEELEKWQFITRILLHEIKNPLASIKGFAQYLKKKGALEGKDKGLEIILKEALRIENLLKELSNYTFSRESEIQLINLKELLEDVAQTLRFLHEEAEFEMNLEVESPEVKSDPEKLRSILTNLMENALYASLEAGKRKIQIALKGEKGYYIMEIKDEGAGIDPEVLPHIFEPFFTTRSRGTGLGLAIVKKFCDELGLTINLQSEKGKGTKVWVKIPRS
jgi:two-component system sensor histidine kinase HydH